MSDDASNEANNSPRHFIILDAIARGITNVDKIANATKLTSEEVELVVNDLSIQRLAVKEERKKRFFGGTKLEVKVTEIGLGVLNSKKQELKLQAEQLRRWNENGDTAQLQSYMNSNNRSWVPFMLFSGIMDVLFFTSIMSMMGMTLNPMESQLAPDSIGAGETDADSGSGDSGETDVGEGDFAGFDGGGFGDF